MSAATAPGRPPALGACGRLLHPHRIAHSWHPSAGGCPAGRKRWTGQEVAAGPARAPPRSPLSATHCGEACRRLHTPGASLGRRRRQGRRRGVRHTCGPLGPVRAGTPLLSTTWAGWFPDQPAAGLRPGVPQLSALRPHLPAGGRCPCAQPRKRQAVRPGPGLTAEPLQLQAGPWRPPHPDAQREPGPMPGVGSVVCVGPRGTPRAGRAGGETEAVTHATVMGHFLLF